ncbi:MAG TPA: hypothetical protein VKT75_04915 [Acidobacteriaceae bacterium]|nr:hypothetical protein [Acidobacteriaceae bacterium]
MILTPPRTILLLSLLYPMGALPQGSQLEVIQKPVAAQHLDGTVRMHWDGQPVSNVHVEECDSGWKDVLASTQTDSRGHFHLTPLGNRPLHYIKIYAPGFNIREYRVRLSKRARPELELEINVGT